MIYKTIREFDNKNSNFSVTLIEGFGYTTELTNQIIDIIDNKVKETIENELIAHSCSVHRVIESDLTEHLIEIYMVQNFSFIIKPVDSDIAIYVVIPNGYVKSLPIITRSLSEDIYTYRFLTGYPIKYNNCLLYSTMKGCQPNNRNMRIYGYKDKLSGAHKFFNTSVIRFDNKKHKYEGQFIGTSYFVIINSMTVENNSTHNSTSYYFIRPEKDSEIENEILKEIEFRPL